MRHFGNDRQREINKTITINDLLNSKENPDRFDIKKAIEIEGYIFGAKDEGGESCNCYSNNPKDLDVHVYLAKDMKAENIGDCVVIEVSKYGKTIHTEWNAKYINQHYYNVPQC